MSVYRRSFLIAVIYTCSEIEASYAVSAGVVIIEDKTNSETTSDGSTTDEITKVEITGDESRVSKFPVISRNDFIAFSLNNYPDYRLPGTFRLRLKKYFACEE
jgi:hypothetical protein